MYGLTSLGVVHTAISLVAVAAALIAFVRDRGIVAGNTLGKVYIVTTILTCVTGLFIFAHGGPGKAHGLAVLTLLVLLLADLTLRRHWFGGAGLAVATVCYSATFLFHMIPAVTETTTRLPLGAPLLASAEAPELQAATGLMFLLFLIGATLQVRHLRTMARQGRTPQSAAMS